MTTIAPFGRPEADLLPRAAIAQWGEDSLVGPAVVVAIYLDERSVTALTALELDRLHLIDSGAMSRIARRISFVLPYEAVVLPPRRWNTLVNRLSNRDRVLSWAYRRALSQILTSYPSCRAATYDSSCPGFAVVEGELPGGEAVPLVYRPMRGFEVGQTTASVLARATFVRSTAELTRRLSVELPAPPGDPIPVLRRLLDERGREPFLSLVKRDDARAQAMLEKPGVDPIEQRPGPKLNR